MLSFVLLAVALPLVAAAPACTGTIASMSDVAAAVKCTTVNINSFTVPAGQTFNLDLADGTTVNLSMTTSCFLAAAILTYINSRRRRILR